jgi:hypothetical protein
MGGISIKLGVSIWVWWYTLVIPALRRMRQENCELEISQTKQNNKIKLGVLRIFRFYCNLS